MRILMLGLDAAGKTSTQHTSVHTLFVCLFFGHTLFAADDFTNIRIHLSQHGNSLTLHPNPAAILISNFVPIEDGAPGDNDAYSWI